MTQKHHKNIIIGGGIAGLSLGGRLNLTQLSLNVKRR